MHEYMSKNWKWLLSLLFAIFAVLFFFPRFFILVFVVVMLLFALYIIDEVNKSEPKE